ncbi:MAG: site-specific DNA-methyltransferase [Sedimentisphaerales bacterium]|nr:site-specific DNA-methyltransferase [Sedimentisphaerales bacterium]
MEKLRNQILCGDCVEILREAPEPFADLVFADPPFNIGYKYDKYHDKKRSAKYLAWSEAWIAACVRVLKPHGSFYIAIGDEYVANLKLIADQQGLVLRNWIIWHYTFGQQTKTKFARAHTHILYFAKDAKHLVFNDEVVRVLSDRQKKYKDKRANPAGKIPDDVWNEYPRICGTFAERTGFPCQMPESLLARIIRVSSNEGDWVLDPFCGSGTTATVAHKLGRIYTTTDVSEEYVAAARQRIAQSEGLPVEGEGAGDWPEHAEAELCWLYSENKMPLTRLCASPVLLSLFTAKLNDRLRKTDLYTPEQVRERLTLLEDRCRLNAQLSDRYSSV